LNFAAWAFRDPRSEMSVLARIRQYPINDVSTDVEDPPRLDAPDGAAGGGPEMTEKRRKKVQRAYPELLGGLVLALPPKEAFALAEARARAQSGWNVRRVEPGQGMLTAVAVTLLLRFKDDITVRVRPQAAGSRVDVRSRSRVGRDDLGANAARIRRFFRDLQAAQPH
jgi:Protein of unknown function (DUF1499)